MKAYQRLQTKIALQKKENPWCTDYKSWLIFLLSCSGRKIIIVQENSKNFESQARKGENVAHEKYVCHEGSVGDDKR